MILNILDPTRRDIDSDGDDDSGNWKKRPLLLSPEMILKPLPGSETLIN